MLRSIHDEEEYNAGDWIVNLRQTIISHTQGLDLKIAQLLDSVVAVFEFAYEASASDNVPGSDNWYYEIEDLFSYVEKVFVTYKRLEKTNLQNQLQFLITCAELEGLHESAEFLKRQLETDKR